MNYPSRVLVIVPAYNEAESIQATVKAVIEEGYDYVVVNDGSTDNTLEVCRANHLNVLDLPQNLGSRFLEQTGGFQSTFLRRVGITWLSRVIKICTGKHITDPTSGFRACGPRAIDYFCKNYPVDYPEPDSIVSVLTQGLSVSEISVVMKERQGGASSISGFSSAYYMIKVTLAIIISACSKKRC